METFNQRLLRFASNSPVEFIETLLNSIANDFMWELELASKQGQNNLLILGIMSVIKTVSEKIFIKSGLKGCKFYLKNFVDGKSDDLKFSEIAKDINDWRNVIAHQWISRQGHSFVLDVASRKGFILNNGVLIINPQIFFEQFKSAFETSSTKINYTIWQYDVFMTATQMNKAKSKFIDIFKRR